MPDRLYDAHPEWRNVSHAEFHFGNLLYVRGMSDLKRNDAAVEESREKFDPYLDDDTVTFNVLDYTVTVMRRKPIDTGLFSVFQSEDDRIDYISRTHHIDTAKAE